MAKITLTEQPEFLVLPENSILLTKVDAVRIRDVDGQRGTWQKLELTFKVLDIQTTGDGSPVDTWEVLIGTPIWGSVPFRLTDSPENKLRQWVEAIYDMSLDVGFELDTDLLEGRQVRAVTSVYERKKNIDPRTGKPSMQHQVEALLPARARGAGAEYAAAPAAAAAPAWGHHVAAGSVATVSDPNWSDEPPF